MEQNRGRLIRFIDIETFIHLLVSYGLLNEKEADFCMRTRLLPDDILLRIKQLEISISN